MAVVIVLRSTKGSELTWSELDQNFSNIKTILDALGTAANGTLTTSKTDSTTGRVLRVGDFGVGETASSDFAGDLDSCVAGGIYSLYGATVTANWPTGATQGSNTASLIVGVRSSSFVSQLFIGTRGDIRGKVWIRAKSDAGWGSWLLLYGQSSILGSVSQSGGVPTGAIIERGSNANGEYVKFADGTMICTFIDSSTLAIDQASGSLYYSASYSKTFPATFITAPIVIPAGNRATGISWAFLTGSPSTTSSGSFGAMSNVSGGTFYPGYVAIGRWF